MSLSLTFFVIPNIAHANLLFEKPEWTDATKKVLSEKHRIKLGATKNIVLQLNSGSGTFLTCESGDLACKAVKIQRGTDINTITFDSTADVFVVGSGNVTSFVFKATQVVGNDSIQATLKVGVDENPCFKFNTVKSCTLAQDCQWIGTHCKDVKGENKAPTKRGFSKEEESEIAQKAQAAAVEADANSKLNNLGNVSISIVIGTVIRAILGIVGSIALAMFVYGGFTIMTAAGNAERTKKGTEILVWSALGVVVILASYALVDLVFDVFR